MSRVLVIGGGIQGLLAARCCRLAGLDVTLVEAGRIGHGASWAGGGILMPLYPWRSPPALMPLLLESLRAFPVLHQELLDATGIDPGYRRSGMLVLEGEQAGEARAWGEQQGFSVEHLPAGELHARFPGVTCGREGALWLPEVCQVRNPRLLRALHRYLESVGVTILEHRPVAGLRHDDHRVLGVDTPAGPVAADIVILTAGAWSGPLLRRLGTGLELRPVRGQMLCYQAEPGLLATMVLARGRYLVPREDGIILAGSTLEYAGLDCRTTREARLELEMAAMRMLPALAGFPLLRHWAGLRPGSPRGIPAIGPHPLLEGLYLSIGHFRNGLLTAPASAALLCDLIGGRSPCIDPSPYRVPAGGRLR